MRGVYAVHVVQGAAPSSGAGALPPSVGLGLLAEGAGRVDRLVGVVVLMPLVYASIRGER